MEKFKPTKRKCKNCGKEFLSIRKWHEFCCSDCRLAYWKLKHPVVTPDVLEDIEKIKKHIGLT